MKCRICGRTLTIRSAKGRGPYFVHVPARVWALSETTRAAVDLQTLVAESRRVLSVLESMRKEETLT